MANEKISQNFKNISVTFCGAIALWLVISHIAHFRYPDYFYNANPDIHTYVGINVVSAFADFSFFTYITIILFGLRCVLLGAGNLIGLNKLCDFLNRDTVSVFVFLNYAVTVTLYTAFEPLTLHPTFGWYGNYPLSWHSLGTNIIGHYLLFIVEAVLFFKEKTTKGNLKRALVLVSVFLTVYYAAVKIAGEYAYDIRWFPYIIFDVESFGVTLGISDKTLSTITLIITCVVIFIGYLAAFVALVKFKSKKTYIESRHAQ